MPASVEGPEAQSQTPAFLHPAALTQLGTSVTLWLMNSRIACSALLAATCIVAGCRQPDGAYPEPVRDVPNRLHDLQRDLESIAGGDAEGPKDLADDLIVFTEEPEGQAAARTFAGSVSYVVLKRMLNEDALMRLSNLLWKTVASRDLSERQVDGMKDDMRGLLSSIGVSQKDANAVADRLGQTQKAVTLRSRRWYERY